jgi:hypothetical protein
LSESGYPGLEDVQDYLFLFNHEGTKDTKGEEEKRRREEERFSDICTTFFNFMQRCKASLRMWCK